MKRGAEALDEGPEAKRLASEFEQLRINEGQDLPFDDYIPGYMQDIAEPLPPAVNLDEYLDDGGEVEIAPPFLKIPQHIQTDDRSFYEKPSQALILFDSPNESSETPAPRSETTATHLSPTTPPAEDAMTD